MNAISTHKLTKYYGNQVGIKDVSLNVLKGEVFGFVGPNGAGKSTAIRTLLGLLKPNSGSAQIFGLDISTDGPKIRTKIGYLPSEVFYYQEMTAREMLQYHLDFYPRIKENKIEELAEYFELKLDRPITDLSFGNKKKCGIVQCLLHQPELLILDEPTSGLDPLMQNRFYDLIQSENEKGVTVFISSHILSEIQRSCDRAAVIKNGEIIAVETITELLHKQMKKVSVIYKDTPEVLNLPPQAFNEKIHHKKLTFEYKGELKILLKWLLNQEVRDVVIEEPNLESIFMNYYQR